MEKRPLALKCSNSLQYEEGWELGDPFVYISPLTPVKLMPSDLSRREAELKGEVQSLAIRGDPHFEITKDIRDFEYIYA